ncbi:helix-turn-helix transcriptional regulator [Flavobacterium sp. ANB]|uniref:helix-turn-helix domain-containing protein n=1 Tax=unclassified Flavobacterium TaxID=196869 RepID=UPI0012BA34C9|nr:MULTISPECIES: helix-turn-helix transcriptional regulator [unclassified Flavobacterium]MBF4519484.1 helix-turn-helix transcriptional regulator [Flavobacterium sp. ANB]MTD72505.1 helix-turn-helix domain-containing protein [Flavobacterium sp. LC2016-13]
MELEHEFFMKLGSKIRRLRETKNLSQEALANDCNLPTRQIGRVERAEINPTLRTLIKIANALELTPSELLNISNK